MQHDLFFFRLILETQMLSLVLRKITGYNVYFSQYLLKSNSSFSEASASASKKWKNLPEKEKERFNTEASKLPEKKKHSNKSAHSAFISENFSKLGDKSNPLDQTKLNEKWASMTYEQKSKYGKVKDPNAPKKPTHAYGHFVQQKHAEFYKEHGTPQEAMKSLGKAWKNLSEEEKASYKK